GGEGAAGRSAPSDTDQLGHHTVAPNAPSKTRQSVGRPRSSFRGPQRPRRGVVGPDQRSQGGTDLPEEPGTSERGGAIRVGDPPGALAIPDAARISRPYPHRREAREDRGTPSRRRGRRSMMPSPPFAYPVAAHRRRHAPAGYADYQNYKPWLRDEFTF